MNNRWNNFLCGIDRATNIIVWRWPNWNQWPKMVSVDLDIEIHNFSGLSFDYITENDYDNFAVRREFIDGRWALTRSDITLTPDQVNDLAFKKAKCRAISVWLNRLYQKISESEGILPGIYNAALGSQEEKLLLQRRDKVRFLVQEQVANYHDKLWLATNQEELQEILNTAQARWNI